MLAKELLESIKEFRVDDELPFGTVDYMNIDTAIAELAALEAVAEAARTGRGLDEALDKLYQYHTG